MPERVGTPGRGRDFSTDTRNRCSDLATSDSSAGKGSLGLETLRVEKLDLLDP